MEYTDDSRDPYRDLADLAPILDFSYAGYDHGESGIPTAMGAPAA